MYKTVRNYREEFKICKTSYFQKLFAYYRYQKCFSVKHKNSAFFQKMRVCKEVADKSRIF